MIGREVADERGLTLASAPVYVARHDTAGEVVSYAMVIGQALGRRALMDLLFTLAPYKAHGPDRFARVLDNWRLHDRAKAGGASESLFLQHARSLGFSWQEFSRHRETFIATFEDQTEATRLLPVLSWVKAPAGTRQWRFDIASDPIAHSLETMLSEVHEAALSESLHPDSLLGPVTIPYFLPELSRRWPAWRPLTKGGKSNYVGPASVPMMALIHRRALLNSALIRSAEAYIDE
jgi:hypothetical protein